MTPSGHIRAAQAARQHWRVSLAATSGVLALSAIVSFAPPLLVHWLASFAVDVTVAGTPWPYFIGAQGAVLAFVVLVIAYIVIMSRADRRYRDALRDAAEMPDATAAHGVEDRDRTGDRDFESGTQ
ncbi:DUF4212 domain-containing protein [Robbsia sp. KACC 23696]|uniref:DUF4212 domain-containing protein n=1 Tax=Robbsia sp. KACC 23696 TaxID=3149231 RepID=UPI00325B06FF